MHRKNQRPQSSPKFATYEYDAAGRVTKTVSLDTGATRYTYNLTGTLASKTDANGVTIKYVSDNLNRLTEMQFPDSSQNITYTYDECTNGKGRVCTMTDPSGTTSYEYDKLRRVVKETKHILGSAYTTGYAYDKAGNLTAITYPSGRRVSYSYDSVNRPLNVNQLTKHGTMTVGSGINYDKVGNTLSMTLGNGLTEKWTYNPNNTISTITVSGVLNLTYTYDPVTNINAINNVLEPANTKTYRYDALDRLATAKGPWENLVWTYDANGNRLTQTNGMNNKYSYEANRLMTASNGHINYYQYDKNGNTTSDGQRDFVYNQNQRLIRVIKKGRVVGEYAYNGNGQRAIKKTKMHEREEKEKDDDDEYDHTTVFHYDQSGSLIEETTARGKLIADYIYLDGKPLAMIRKQEHKDEMFYYHNDHLGTPKVMTDKLRKVMWRVEFDPFGNVLDADEPEHEARDHDSDREHDNKGRRGEYIREVTNNLRFPGQYFDIETGLNYNYYRDYNPVIGRYIEADPIGLRGGINLYGYARQAPTNSKDVLGLLFSDQAFRHYIDGTGTPLGMGFDEIDTSSVRPSQFSQVRGVLSGGCGTRVVSINDTRSFSTSGDAALTVGYITLRLRAH